MNTAVLFFSSRLPHGINKVPPVGTAKTQLSNEIGERAHTHTEQPNRDVFMFSSDTCWTKAAGSSRRRPFNYLHEAPDVLLLLQEVLVEASPVGDQLQHLPLPEEGVFSLLLAPAAGAAIGENGQGDSGQRRGG